MNLCHRNYGIDYEITNVSSLCADASHVSNMIQPLLSFTMRTRDAVNLLFHVINIKQISLYSWNELSGPFWYPIRHVTARWHELLEARKYVFGVFRPVWHLAGVTTKAFLSHLSFFQYIKTAFPCIDGILPKGPYPPCLRMADRAFLAGYPRYMDSY